MAEKSSSLLHKLDVTLRVLASIVGTLPMTVLLLSLISRGLWGSSGLGEALVLVLVLPCWLSVCCVCIVAKSGVRVAAGIALVTVAASLLLRVVG
jgi:hypothetical protein